MYHQFQLKVNDFVELLTGKCPSSYKDAIETLREISSRKYYQYKILYDTIEKLQSELDEKQQTITCLGYRHVLEKLPNKTSNAFKSHPDYPSPPAKLSATRAWHITWDLAVTNQLSSMIQEYNNARAAVAPTTLPATTAAAPAPSTAHGSSTAPGASTAPSTSTAPGASTAPGTSTAPGMSTAPGTSTAPAPSTAPGSSTAPGVSTAPGPPTPVSLDQVLRYDFDFHTQLWANSAGRIRKGQPIPTLGSTNLASYKDWPSYTRGKSLYSALSTNIHSFGKSYEIHEINWLKMDYDTLRWLKPTGTVPASTDDPSIEEAYWNGQWTDRNLPA